MTSSRVEWGLRGDAEGRQDVDFISQAAAEDGGVMWGHMIGLQAHTAYVKSDNTCMVQIPVDNHPSILGPSPQHHLP